MQCVKRDSIQFISRVSCWMVVSKHHSLLKCVSVCFDGYLSIVVNDLLTRYCEVL